MIKNNFVNLYSEAFFHLCCEKKISFSQYLKNTTELIDLLSVKNQYFGNWFLSLKRDKLKLVIKDIFANNIDQYYFNLLQILVDENNFDYLLDILFKLERLFLDKLNFTIATVYSVIKLKPNQLKKINQNLVQRLKSKIKLFSRLDKSLIAGLRVESETFIFDNSLRKQILDLEKNLLSSFDK